MARGCSAVGEGSVNYSKRERFPETASRIAKGLPDARLIYIVRKPLERIASDWAYTRATGLETKTFTAAVRARPAYYVAPSDYLAQIDTFRAYYSDERILVLFFEDMKADLRGVLRRCFTFLGVDEQMQVRDTETRNTLPTVRRATWLNRLWLPNLRRFSALVPSRVRAMLRPFYQRRVEKPVWTREAFESITSELWSNTRVFLERYGAGEDFWSLRFEDFEER